MGVWTKGRSGRSQYSSSNVYFTYRTTRRGSKVSLLEPVELPLMDEVEAVALQHVPGQGGGGGGGRGAGGGDWHVQHVEVTWWVVDWRGQVCWCCSGGGGGGGGLIGG